ncbi:UDP-glucose 4-epimerase [Luminiphilus syltensis NOR5-1B]|uniref:UDP-glucose 4-epimerase n=1 Tax=Luminiphilus syltensis NOR5-1B TaxID=565045 RepID=B8KV25_9GAMM|nr:UDP-glucose 4-epimerase GalE [Luminiphilus syltensis]EED34612.1 UDP-glucose 4-epimerase [Luminiphilus syltensis NOR5-1B]
MHFLVTGGAGYVGSHIVRTLLRQGHTTVILDDFSTGHRWATQGQEVVEVDLKDLPALRAALAGREFHGIFHFAAKSLVGESDEEALLYYQNNVDGTSNLLRVALENGWHRCVFSSTAAVYGNPVTATIDEDHPKAPINVYGETKLAMENLLEGVCNSKSFGAVCLRYFNAAGAADDASIGEAHTPETHLIPRALKAAAGNGGDLTIFGDDYPTADGTCIRDYIHVEDLADAHSKAMDYLQQHSGFVALNLGTGSGFSVKSVVNACEKVVNRAIPHTVGPRRSGDPDSLIADASKAKKLLGWRPKRTDLHTIVASAWAWEQVRPVIDTDGG